MLVEKDSQVGGDGWRGLTEFSAGGWHFEVSWVMMMGEVKRVVS